MSRGWDLLDKAAVALERGEDPFHESFLIEHEVTLDEVYDLSDRVAAAIRYMQAMAEVGGAS